MSNLDRGILTIPIREAWIELPEPEADIEAAIQAILERFEFGSDADARRRLGASLRTVHTVASALPSGARRNNALVLSPSSGRVEALLSLRVSRTVPGSYAEYLAAARALTGDERIEIIQRTVEEIDLPAGPAVLSRDFALPRSDGGVADPAMERAFLALFLADHDTVTEFTLLTQNLALFTDAGGYLSSLAAGENPPLPGMED